MRPGEIYIAFFEEAGPHPIIIVSRENDLSQLDLASGPRGVLDELSLRDVIKAIGYVIESDCEPV